MLTATKPLRGMFVSEHVTLSNVSCNLCHGLRDQRLWLLHATETRLNNGPVGHILLEYDPLDVTLPGVICVCVCVFFFAVPRSNETDCS